MDHMIHQLMKRPGQVEFDGGRLFIATNGWGTSFFDKVPQNLYKAMHHYYKDNPDRLTELRMVP